ncbi:MAG: hypothetical protein K2X08_08095 [Chlamydiales bacterium]|nr:hypothetical protein [Chlamydiales bacterium]
MTSMSMLHSIVKYQMGGGAPFPSAEQMMSDSETRIARWEERLARIQTSVTATLTERSAVAMHSLEKCLTDMTAENPYSSLELQKENIAQMLADIKQIHEVFLESLKKIHAEIREKKEQNMALQAQLQSL